MTTYVLGSTVLYAAGHAPVAVGDADDPLDVGHVLAHVPAGSVVHVHPQAIDGLADRDPESGEDLKAAPFVTGALLRGWDVRVFSRWYYLARQDRAPWTALVFDAEAPQAAAGPWHHAGSARAAAGGLGLWGEAARHVWGPTTNQTAEQLIRSTNRGGRGTDAPGIPEPVWELSERPWAAWRRQPTTAEAARGWVVWFDVNAQYLGAWVSAELGMNTRTTAKARELVGPHHVTGGRVDYMSPSLWRLAAPLPEEPIYPALPNPWGPGPWYTAPTLRRAAEVLDDLPAAAEGWVWPTHARYLRAAGERLRDARQMLSYVLDRDPAEVALARAANAEVYQRFTGSMASESRRKGAETDDFARPDWAHTVIALARVNLHRRLTTLWETCGLAPFVIRTDGLGFYTDEPDPVMLAYLTNHRQEGHGIPLGAGLGRWHHVASYPHTPELAAALADAPSGAAVTKVLAGAPTWERGAGT